MPAEAPVSAIVVCSFEDPEVVAATVRSLREQSRPPAEVLIVDNHPEGVVGEELARQDPEIRVLRPGENLGYPQACNFAAPHATQPWMFFLNPDAFAEPDCLERLLAACDDGVAIAGAQVLLPDGVTINAGDNPVHLSGLSWSGHYLEPREDGPPRDVAAVSGAACLIRTAVFRELGGHCPAFFLYHDDVDIAWRARMAGHRVRFVPGAAIRHDYDFDKGARKWFCLEHNRLYTVLANYEVRTLLLLAPLLLAAELGIALLARRDGWWGEKVRAWKAIAAGRGELARWRRHVQAHRRLHDAPVLAPMTASLDTPLVRAPGATVVEPLLALYRRAVLALARR